MKNKRKFLEACAFLVLLCCVLVGTSNLVERKESRERYSTFLDHAQEYDVLFFGDSTMVDCVFPMELWADYGIASYNLSAPGSVLATTYWTMINALDYAQPKLAVIGVNSVRWDRKLVSNSGNVHTTFDFWPLSRNKVRAIEDLMNDPASVDGDGSRYADFRWEYYFKIGKYHARFSELTKNDFFFKPDVQNGGEIKTSVTPVEDYDIIDEDRCAEERGLGFEYLRRAIEECQRRGIEVLLVYTPFPTFESAQEHANRVGRIAEEYEGVNYINFVALDSVTDYMVDCRDSAEHMNGSGGQKVTDYLGRYIMDHYDVQDRREETEYAHWQQDFDAYLDYKLSLMEGEAENLHNLLMLLHDSDFDVRVAVNRDAPLYSDEVGIVLMHNITREHVYEECEYTMWSNAMFPLGVFDEASWENEPYYLAMENGTAYELMGEEAQKAAKENFGETDAAVMVQVIDRRTGKPAVQLTY